MTDIEKAFMQFFGLGQLEDGRMYVKVRPPLKEILMDFCVFYEKFDKEEFCETHETLCDKFIQQYEKLK